MTIIQTKSQFAYEWTKDQIVTGKFRPGDKLNVTDLADGLQVSEIPVREALKRLEAENFVSWIPHVGFRVTPVTSRALVQMFAVRINLEKLAAELAFPALGRALGELEQLEAEMKGCLAENRLDQYWRVNRRFHGVIYAPCDNDLLMAILQQLLERSSRARAIFALSPNRAKTSALQHEGLLRAIREGDKEALVAGIGHHLSSSLEELLSSQLVADGEMEAKDKP